MWKTWFINENLTFIRHSPASSLCWSLSNIALSLTPWSSPLTSANSPCCCWMSVFCWEAFFLCISAISIWCSSSLCVSCNNWDTFYKNIHQVKNLSHLNFISRNGTNWNKFTDLIAGLPHTLQHTHWFLLRNLLFQLLTIFKKKEKNFFYQKAGFLH